MVFIILVLLAELARAKPQIYNKIPKYWFDCNKQNIRYIDIENEKRNLEIEKQKFHYRKNPISMYDVNINTVLLSNMVPCGKENFKYFIGYKNDKK